MVILLLILIVFNGVNIWQNEQEDRQLMSMAAKYMSSEEPDLNSGQMRHGRGRETEVLKALMNGKLSVILLDNDGEITDISGFAEEYSEKKLVSIAETITAGGKKRGRTEGFKYSIETGNEGNSTIVLLEAGLLGEGALQMLLISVAGFAVAALLFGLLARLLSNKIAGPVDRSIRMQKQFIADASHELKTPVTVINANITLLEKEVGHSQWLNFIKEESQRITDLTGSLLQISRLDYEADIGGTVPPIEYDLANIVLGAALPFESVAFEQQVRLETDIPRQLIITGYPDDLRQLTGILLDNALKHTSAGGRVSVQLSETGKKIVLKVSNTGQKIPDDILPFIFDRFYKQDFSRKYETNSFGLGLAIAKALIEKNNGRITATSTEAETVFVVELYK